MRPKLTKLSVFLAAIAIAVSGTVTSSPVSPAFAAEDVPVPDMTSSPSNEDPFGGSVEFVDGIRTAPFAAAATTFDAGTIISDDNFYNGAAMNEAEVQAFLNAQMKNCAAGFTCLKDYRAASATFAADAMCQQYTGAASESAARIIARVGEACGISQKVLLVLLQKEQSLVKATAPTPRQYAAATGYNCPDNAPCSTRTAQFFDQVYHAAWQYKRYSVQPGFSWYPVGKTSNILYFPTEENPNCGSSPVFITNNATAALYYYTPYQPNAAALANPGGVGDNCSSYGNRNFFEIYTTWFGDPTTTVTGVTRYSGADRFAASAAISAANFDAGVATVYIANGLNFPDALAGAPVAAKDGSPILLVTSDGIPTSIGTELTRLKPGRIVILGGTASILPSLESTLQRYTTGEVSRLAGVDRFAAAATISAENFEPGVDVAYITNGLNFPDALAGGPVAGINKAPILLVMPGEAPAVTLAELERLDPGKIVILGGINSVSSAVQAAVAGFTTGGVTRFDGPDRFAASAAISAKSFTSASVVYVANGLTFPDALSGAPVAGRDGSPVLLVTPHSIPASVRAELDRLDPSEIVILGGPNSVSVTVKVQLSEYTK
ncbi:putative cell wall-binding protein [Glaciihabitans tibetensis]|uniref:Putative cell wall-binding protein n=1 Tax=Glaciihabitans tibetensis TaxID=1266600 RepID=A0A2T0VFD8_9MICO|nr:cell wall-binding repeat-containing protein [Glaciihabitans tibetensis]PRY68886.1 putative cell wall-binding protein [Glaciihabitans tibetensis]